ncbi:NAD(P)/FAD-dependent oxidoreductase [Pseudomonas taiwanensis]|uniref:NAD(P)/FAD-dependent oxidoreductase n=1 Tax=Pseudomonas taiwanensis TaxID=470150 RepID=UPI00192DE2AE|nr:FAD-dependent oxidoreductase [Pseudomonas taiwanensis]
MCDIANHTDRRVCKKDLWVKPLSGMALSVNITEMTSFLEARMGNRAGLDVAIVGAGLVGLTAALQLQRAGMNVTIVEKGLIGTQQPRLSLTKVFSFCANLFQGVLTDRGAALVPVLASELGYIVSENSSSDRELQKTNEQPVLLTDLARDLLKRCTDCGVRVFEQESVESLVIREGKVVGCHTSWGILLADEVVVSAGIGGLPLLSSLGVVLPVIEGVNRLGASRARSDVPGVFSGTVPLTPDGRPYLGRPKGIDGLIVAVGHDVNPVAALAVGEAIEQLITDPIQMGNFIELYSLERDLLTK